MAWILKRPRRLWRASWPMALHFFLLPFFAAGSPSGAAAVPELHRIVSRSANAVPREMISPLNHRRGYLSHKCRRNCPTEQIALERWLLRLAPLGARVSSRHLHRVGYKGNGRVWLAYQ